MKDGIRYKLIGVDTENNYFEFEIPESIPKGEDPIKFILESCTSESGKEGTPVPSEETIEKYKRLAKTCSDVQRLVEPELLQKKKEKDQKEEAKRVKEFINALKSLKPEDSKELMEKLSVRELQIVRQIVNRAYKGKQVASAEENLSDRVELMGSLSKEIKTKD